MGLFRFYVQPFHDSGHYSGIWRDITDDVPMEAVGQLVERLDNTDFDTGVFRVSNLRLSLDNSRGKFSDVGTGRSIFRFKRADSLVKITWAADLPFMTGVGQADEGQILAPEVDIFTGLLNDDSAKMNIGDSVIAFTVLGREDLFKRVEVPFGELADGDLVSEVIFKILSQDQITAILTVSADSINPNIDHAIDDVSVFENKTVDEVLPKLLQASNSVLIIDDGAVVVSPRTPSAELMFTYFGAGSPRGAENVDDIQNVASATSRLINFVTWKSTSLLRKAQSSIDVYGVRKKELDFDFLTDNAKRSAIMNSLIGEFSAPKQEFDLLTPLTYDLLERRLLDRVSVDYPLIPVASDGEFSRYGRSKYGEARYPQTIHSFRVNRNDHFKILSRTMDMASGMAKLHLRAV